MSGEKMKNNQRHLSSKDRMELIKSNKKWDGIERRKAINSYVDPYHERRRIKNDRLYPK